MKSLCIIPVYNEEPRLQDLLSKINIVKKKIKNLDFLIIDNGSNDNSSKLILKSKLKKITLSKNFGVGYALLKGLKYAINKKYDILIHMAGNGKMMPNEIRLFLKKILIENYSFVNGSRFLPGGNYKTNPMFRVIMIKVLSRLISLIYKKKITDITCGFRAFKISLLKNKINLLNKKKFFTYRYEYYTYGKILIKIKNKCTEIPITMKYPKKNYSKIKPIIDWYPIIAGWIEARFDGKKL